MREINQKHIETNIISLVVVEGYACYFKREAFASFAAIALRP